MAVKSKKVKSTFREYGEAICMALLLALFIRTFIVQAFKIPSGSMIPTLQIGDHILVNKLAYGVRIPLWGHYVAQFKTPQRGDVVVFIFPEDRTKDFIKRVVGVAGDVVEIRDGSGRVHGRGLANYAADACRKLVGRHSEEIDAILGWRGYDALITRDNLVMGAV